VASYQGLTLNNRRLKIGWGKNSGPLPPTLALAVHSGATRNVYIGNVEDYETFTEEKLKRDFGEYGDIELVNFLKEKCVTFSLFIPFPFRTLIPLSVMIGIVHLSTSPILPMPSRLLWPSEARTNIAGSRSTLARTAAVTLPVRSRRHRHPLGTKVATRLPPMVFQARMDPRQPVLLHPVLTPRTSHPLPLHQLSLMPAAIIP